MRVFLNHKSQDIIHKFSLVVNTNIRSLMVPEIFHGGERNAESFDVKQVICFDHFMAVSTGGTNEEVRLPYIG